MIDSILLFGSRRYKPKTLIVTRWNTRHSLAYRVSHVVTINIFGINRRQKMIDLLIEKGLILPILNSCLDNSSLYI